MRVNSRSRRRKLRLKRRKRDNKFDRKIGIGLMVDAQNKKTWGGYRENTPEPNWNYGKTKTVRVPIALAEKVLAIARMLDMEEIELSIDDEEEFKKAISAFKPGKFNEALERLHKACDISLKKNSKKQQ